MEREGAMSNRSLVQRGTQLCWRQKGGREERGQASSFAPGPGHRTVVQYQPREHTRNAGLQGHGAEAWLLRNVGRDGPGSSEDPRGEPLNLAEGLLISLQYLADILHLVLNPPPLFSFNQKIG